MKKALLISAVILLLAALAGLAVDSEKNLTIQYNLSGRLNSPENKELVVIFSDDMLPLGGTRDGRQVLKLTPAVEGEFLWRGTRTLALKPKGRFAYSTRYRAAIPKGTRSLNGQILKDDVNWEFTTPPAMPVAFRTSNQDYFTDLVDKEKFTSPVWVADPVFVRFNQEITAAGVRPFLAVRDLDSKKEAPFTLEQKTPEEIGIRFSAPLRRETVYRILFRKGLRGTEGDMPLDSDAYWDFATVPRFRFAGAARTRILVDRKTFSLEFTNRLKEVRKEQVFVFLRRDEKLTPLDRDIDSYNQNDLRITVKSDLNSGDLLTVKVNPNLVNVYGESLDRETEIAVDVCSSHNPAVQSAVSNGRLEISGYSIQTAQVRLFRLADDFYGDLNESRLGILKQPNFADRRVVGESTQSIDFGGETSSRKAFDLGKTLPPKPGQPADRGFFGVLVNQAVPFNSCWDGYLYRFPIFHPFRLEVFHRRDIDFVVKASRYNTLYWVYQNRLGNPVPGSVLQLFHGREPLNLGQTDAQGLLQNDRVLGDEDLIHARPAAAPDQAFFRVENTGWNREWRDIRIHVFSDRDFYRPGDTVHVGGVIKEFRESRIFNPEGGKAELSILDPDHQTVKTVSLPLNGQGGFSFDFPSEEGMKKGIYRLRVAYGNRQEIRPVRIDYYQPNTFTVSIADLEKKYLRRETFAPRVQGAYLAGNPMSEDDLEYHLRIQTEAPLSAAFPNPELQKYGFELDEYFQKMDPDIRQREKFDIQGTCRPRIPLERFPKTNFVSGLLFQAVGKSKEGKEFSATSRALFLPGERFAGIRIPYYNNLKQAIAADLILIDAAGKEVSGEVTVSLFRRIYNDRQIKFQPVGESADLFIENRHRYALRVLEPGNYLLKVDSPDSAGNVTSTSADFYVWDSGYSSARDRMEIISERKEYRVGEKLKCYIQSPDNGKALITVETHKIVDSFVIDIGKTTPFELAIKKEYFPDFTLAVTGLYPGNVTRETSCEFTVIDSTRELKVSMESPAEIKPASAGNIRLRVTDSANRPVKARLFVYCVDEGNLSLSRYQTPDLHQFFYYRKGLRYLTPVRTYYSKFYTHWSFSRPTMDIELKEPGIYGRLMAPDGTPVAGGTVTLEDARYRPLEKATTSAEGYYYFPRIGKGKFFIRAEAKGFHPTLGKCSRYDYNQMSYSEFDIVLVPSDRPAAKESEEQEEAMSEMMAGAMAPAPAEGKRAMLMKDKAEDSLPQDAVPDISGIQVRSDFKEVLFFKDIETDAAGEALVAFETSDKLTTYRIMALAYADEDLGKTEKPLVVSKKLLLEEAMPEFARKDDRFWAGVQVSNRFPQEIRAEIVAQPEGIDIRDARLKQIRIGARRNESVWFDFTAPTIGEALIKFFAIAQTEKDGLLKRLPVSDNLVAESMLDFNIGASVRKQVQPPENGEQPRVKVKVAPSILRPAVAIAEKLVFYPYDCLEQRTSKTMPFLVMDDSFVQMLELKIDAAQVRRAIGEYIAVVPEFTADDGGLSYYRGGEHSSDYLTAYVYWALTLAKRKGFAVPAEVMGKVEEYLKKQTLTPAASTFFQFVLSLRRQADSRVLQKLFMERQKLGATGRAFLFKAIRQQLGDGENLRTLLAEFNNILQVEADFAYFDANEPGYDRDLPFRSSRYLTALLLQTVLEAQGTHALAARIMNWLMECDPSQWRTTQTNFWILYAMNEFARKVEKGGATRAEIVVLGDRIGRPFRTAQDDIRVDKEIGGRKEPFAVEVKADQPVYVTTELAYQLRNAGPKNRGIEVVRNVYEENGRPATTFERGKIYQVEILLDADKEVPYCVIDEPIAAGFEVLRQEIASTRTLEEFNRDQGATYGRLWLRAEYAADRIVWYSYGLNGKARITYFIKALYPGEFTWLPATAQGMYHPQYSGRAASRKVTVSG